MDNVYNDFSLSEIFSQNFGYHLRLAEELGISLKTLYNKINQAAKLDKSA